MIISQPFYQVKLKFKGLLTILLLSRTNKLFGRYTMDTRSPIAKSLEDIK